MFRPERMLEVHVLTIQNYLEDLSKEIVRFGGFEVKPVRLKDAHKIFTTSDMNLGKISSKLGKLKERIDKILLDLEVSPEILEKISSERVHTNLDDLESKLSNEEREFYTLKETLQNIEREEIELRLKEIIFNLSKNIEQKIPDSFKETFIFGAMIVIPLNERDLIKKAISEIPHAFYEVGSFKSVSVCFVVCPADRKSELLKLSASFLKFFDLKNLTTSAENMHIEEISEKLEKLNMEKNKVNLSIDEFKKNRVNEVIDLYRSLLYNFTIFKFMEHLSKKDKLVIFSGWIPKKQKENFHRKINLITKNHCIIEWEKDLNVLSEDRNTTIPTKLNNPKIFSSFQGLVELFGIPRFYEIDPTIILTFLYVVMYGLMFGDVGQGIALAITSALISWKFKNLRLIGGLGIAVGISSAIFGILYGSVFGVEGKIIPPVWISPIHDVTQLMAVAIGIGIFVITLGLILNIINSLFERNLLKLFLSSKGIAGMIFYFSLIIYPGYVFTTGTSLNSNIMLVGILASIICFAIHSYIEAKLHHQNISPAALFFELFEIFISMVSNTVSFIRIAGFALNHTAMMITFFSIGAILNNGTFLGQIISSMVIVIGQIFIIIFEGFIVGIQTLRLSYYEFFTKFFRGGGKVFEPLK